MAAAEWIAPLRELRRTDASRFGPKAASLGEMMHAGLRVPDGFAVSAEAHRFLCGRLGVPADPEGILARNQEIAQMLREAVLPQELSAAIAGVCAPLLEQGATVAVRSSALHEDTPRASFAGAYASFTAVPSLLEALGAYRGCLASFYSDGALDLALSRGVDFAHPCMAVVIQRYVPGRPSGVLFSADPATGRRDRLLVQVVDGPCSDLVDGRSPAASVLLEREGEGIPDSLEGAQGPVRPVADVLLQLREAALRAEALFGCPQDIEWTSEGGRLWVLQARPIVGMRATVRAGDWDPGDGRSWTLVEYHRPLEPLAEEIQLACFRGGARGTGQTGNVGEHHRVLAREGYLYVSPEEIEDAASRRQAWGREVAKLLEQGLNVFTDVIAPRIRRRQAELERYRGRELDAEEAARFLAESLRYAEDLGELHWKAVWGVCYLEGCTGVSRFQDLFGDALSELAPRELWDLVYAPSELTRMRLAVEEMAGVVRADAQLRELFASHTSDRVLWAHLGRVEQGRGVIERVRGLLQRYGHHPGGDWRDPLGPRLQERPWIVLAWARPYLRIAAGSSRESVRRCLEHQERLSARLMERLPPERHRQMEAALALARKAFLARDDHGDLIDASQTAYARWAALEAGRILAARGVLERAQQVWLLGSQEIRDALGGGRLPGRTALRAREAEQERRASIRPPRQLGAQPPEASEPGAQPKRSAAAPRIQGVSGFSGVVCGRIVKACDGDPSVDEPSIVLIPHVRAFDPAPQAGRVLGIIVASGSSFSHLGSVCRELGIPALFGARGAWELLADGDEVQIDGETGSVTVLS